MKDRRRHQRDATSFPVEYNTVDREESGGPVRTRTVDVSEGGLGIETPEPLEPGETISLELQPDPRQRPVLAIGRVVFQRRQGETWVAGVELCWVDGGALSPGTGAQPQALWSFL